MLPNRTITIVMYHYVRQIKNSRYPNIKGLELDLFIRQLDYLTSHYNIIAISDLISGQELPPKAALLTFDDGYSDHYENVWPLLRERGLRGVFAPVVEASLAHKVLDVHKIQFILACASDIAEIMTQVDEFIADHIDQLGFSGPDYRTTMVKRRLDTIEVSFIKDMLQREIPNAMRTELTKLLFEKYVSADEADFASTLYATTDQLQEMCAEGQALSIHGVTHRFLGTLDIEEQRTELTASVEFLDSLGAKKDEISISYPFGSYNDDTLKILREMKVQVGFITLPKVADLEVDGLLTLPRLDTNDLPKM